MPHDDKHHEQPAGSQPDGNGEHESGHAEGGKESSRAGGRERSRAWNPWSTFSEIQETVSDLVDSALRGMGPLSTGRLPRYDLIQVPDEGYWILIDLPGVEREDLDVTTVGDQLTVSGRRRRPELPEGAEVHRAERGYGHFRRTLHLPPDVDASRVKAKLEAGVLRITLPRRGESEERRVDVEA